MIVGGYNDDDHSLSSVEIFNPRTKESCQANDLPMASEGGSLCNNLICGGDNMYHSCLRYNGDGSVTTLDLRLENKRRNHLCWTLPSGEVLLMGGSNSEGTTDKVSADGESSSRDFNLNYWVKYVL